MLTEQEADFMIRRDAIVRYSISAAAREFGIEVKDLEEIIQRFSVATLKDPSSGEVLLNEAAIDHIRMALRSQTRDIANPIVIKLGSLHVINEHFGRNKGRNLYSPELAAEMLNISSGQLENMMILCRLRASFIRIEGAYVSDDDIAVIRKANRKADRFYSRWWN